MEGRWRRWCYWAIMVVHVVGILVFTRGFLLTRTELPYFSHCSDIYQSPCFIPSSNKSSSSSSYSDFNNGNISQDQYCWTRPAVDRLVIIVLDALRFDFVAPSTFFPETKPWMDKLPVLQKMAFQQGSSARIFKAIADPPTTSLQRLKGLTTGGLPTFIDVGNSFGAPAIVEDNFIHQLVINGKRVVMMGDDTWVQLFPHHFNKSYPYPSFNVKDLHTVDNGCVEHLLPSLHQEDWDVLVAHFLGVDHAGHIFGVDSTPMIEKLQQYNLILEKVIQTLTSQSGPGGLHENTLLLVMGDHGQTLNGDHGGGSAEEVETSIFAMSFKQPPFSIPPELDTSSCEMDLDGKQMCVGTMQQLDFAVTVSALLGVSFPFGSIGRVNPELYALGAGTWNLEGVQEGNCKYQSKLEEWVQNYANTLCINSWQVKRYIDVYSASSMIGFSSDDLLHISDIYNKAGEKWAGTKELLFCKNGSHVSLLPGLTKQIDAYFKFLSNVSELARSKWTEFNMKMMCTGLVIMLISLLIVFLAIQLDNVPHIFHSTSRDCRISFELIVAIFIVAVRACSLFSNSYILEEGKVANFLLATTGILKLRYAVMKRKMLLEAVIFLLLISILRFTIEVGLSKQAATSLFMSASPSWMLGIAPGHPIWNYLSEIAPVLALILLSWLLYRTSKNCWGIWKYIIWGTIASYVLIALHWGSESNISSLALLLKGVRISYIPRIVYAISVGQLFLLTFGQLFTEDKTSDKSQSLITKAVAMSSAWSSTIIVLSGKQGSLIALAAVIGGYCIVRLDSIEEDAITGTTKTWKFNPFAVTQWNLLSVCLFFATGHWCAFDGLQYGAAFIGFDEFVLVRQAILLTIETFGFSLILPILGLPFLAVHQYSPDHETNRRKSHVFSQLSQMYMMFGLITATTVTATIMCVAIQRRHLMVWGLFAPKFVFDVVGLILTDVVICLALLFYSGKAENAARQDDTGEKPIPGK